MPESDYWFKESGAWTFIKENKQGKIDSIINKLIIDWTVGRISCTLLLKMIFDASTPIWITLKILKLWLFYGPGLLKNSSISS